MRVGRAVSSAPATHTKRRAAITPRARSIEPWRSRGPCSRAVRRAGQTLQAKPAPFGHRAAHGCARQAARAGVKHDLLVAKAQTASESLSACFRPGQLRPAPLRYVQAARRDAADLDGKPRLAVAIFVDHARVAGETR